MSDQSERSPDDLVWRTRGFRFDHIPYKKRIISTGGLLSKPGEILDHICFERQLELFSMPFIRFEGGSDEPLRTLNLTVWVRRRSRDSAQRELREYADLFPHGAAYKDDVYGKRANEWDTGLWFGDLNTPKPRLMVSTYAEDEFYERILSLRLEEYLLSLSVDVGAVVPIRDLSSDSRDHWRMPKPEFDADERELKSATAGCRQDITLVPKSGDHG